MRLALGHGLPLETPGCRIRWAAAWLRVSPTYKAAGPSPPAPRDAAGSSLPRLVGESSSALRGCRHPIARRFSRLQVAELEAVRLIDGEAGFCGPHAPAPPPSWPTPPPPGADR